MTCLNVTDFDFNYQPAPTEGYEFGTTPLPAPVNHDNDDNNGDDDKNRKLNLSIKWDVADVDVVKKNNNCLCRFAEPDHCDAYREKMKTLYHRKLLFPGWQRPELTADTFRIDLNPALEPLIYSMTPEPIAQSIAWKFSTALQQRFPDRQNNFVLMDAFSGCGALTIQFALLDCVSVVYAVDHDPRKMAIARQLARLYPKRIWKKIKYFTADYCKLVEEKRFSLDVDAVFLGLPWQYRQDDNGASAGAGAEDGGGGGGQTTDNGQYSLHDIKPVDGFEIVETTSNEIGPSIAVSLPLNHFQAELSTLNRIIYHTDLFADHGHDEDNDAAVDLDDQGDDGYVDPADDDDDHHHHDDDNGLMEHMRIYHPYLNKYQIERYLPNRSQVVYFGDLVNLCDNVQNNLDLQQQRPKPFYPTV